MTSKVMERLVFMAGELLRQGDIVDVDAAARASQGRPGRPERLAEVGELLRQGDIVDVDAAARASQGRPGRPERLAERAPGGLNVKDAASGRRRRVGRMPGGAGRRQGRSPVVPLVGADVCW
ncbi:hypothetical protein ACFV0T_34115 [Streptomyces sp. NPDC059582]|uniref:hypothetical protein n=1 Tax=Streptomyces sp. NPDC059582 TaxID=3346875 RepID=UPI0036BBA7E0